MSRAAGHAIVSPTQPLRLVHPAAEAPPAARVGHRVRLLRFLCWTGLILAVAPAIWRAAPAGSDPRLVLLTSLARLSGSSGGYLLLVQILLMCRLRMVERRVGSTRLRGWHRTLGMLVMLLVFSHVTLAIAGRMLADHVPATGEALSLLRGYPGMAAAFAATGLLIGISLLAVRQLRRRLPYELWYYLHTSAYLVVAFSYVHEFLDGRELRDAGPVRYYWLSLYGLVGLAFLWGRVLAPLRLNLRHRLRVAEVVPEGAGVISIYLAGRRLDKLDARAGQFFRWRFLARGEWWQAHPFSLSAAPNSRWLRITVKATGDHTKRLRRVRPGVRVYFEGPSGELTADRRAGGRALLIAGGIGITPIRALLEDLPPGTVVIYRAARVEELMFRQELDWLARQRRAQVWYVIGARDAPGPRRLFTRVGLSRLVPDIVSRDVYVCGPTGLILASLRLLHRMGVPRDQIHVDPFEL
jgi:predicted ferric reductase